MPFTWHINNKNEFLPIIMQNTGKVKEFQMELLIFILPLCIKKEKTPAEAGEYADYYAYVFLLFLLTAKAIAVAAPTNRLMIMTFAFI